MATGKTNSRQSALTPGHERKAFERSVKDLYQPVSQGRKDFGIGSPERQNYRTYMSTLPDRKQIVEQGLTSKDYSLPALAAYDPNTTYTRPVKIDPKKMASGGMTPKTSSASSRGNGIAQRGKTKGRMC